ncbi:MAG: hypothetical protein K0M56_02140 [Kaistella sp.]|nr:hypothetical protein [Kaistella sp.]
MKPISNFKELLIELSRLQTSNFPGIGLVLYSSLDNLDFILMKDNSILSKMAVKGISELIKFFTENCLQNGHYHDGFHLINENLELTHVSTFIAPKIDNNILVVNEFGSRYRTAIYSSTCPGIIATGIIGQSYGPFIFQEGIANRIIH